MYLFSVFSFSCRGLEYTDYILTGKTAVLGVTLNFILL